MQHPRRLDRHRRRAGGAAMTLPETKPKRIKKQKGPIDPNVSKMERLMDMRLDGITWFLANHPVVENHD